MMVGAATSIWAVRSTRSVSGRRETQNKSPGPYILGRSGSHGRARRDKISATVHLQDQVLHRKHGSKAPVLRDLITAYIVRSTDRIA